MLKEGLCILLRKYHSQRRKRFGKGNHIAGRFLDMVTSAVHLDTATHTDAVMSVCQYLLAAWRSWFAVAPSSARLWSSRIRLGGEWKTDVWSGRPWLLGCLERPGKRSGG